nr:ABC transporter permease [Longimycelium tulufanense]
MHTGYLVFELRRTMRSTRFLVFTVAFPIVLFVFFSQLFGNDTPDNAAGIDYHSVIMINMTAWGAMSAALYSGARVAVERGSGWQRQLRLTPLSGVGYLTGKGLSGLGVALPVVILVPLVAITTQGVRLSGAQWVQATVGIWLAAIPFALLGLLLGQLGTSDSMQSITSMLMMVLAILGGLWVPIEVLPDWMHQLARVLPSYWMSQVGRSAVDHHEALSSCALVLAVWTVVLGGLVALRYRRDSARG